MCKEVCKDSGVPYIVAPQEADMQVCRRNPSAIAICFDSDEIAYGCRRVLAVDSYFREKCRDIDLTGEVTPEIATKFPVYAARHKFGLRIFHWFAAVVGCDLSEDKNGIKGSGRGAFVKALEHCEPISITPSDLTAHRFAKVLRDKSREVTRVTYSVKQIENELNRISAWFTRGGTYYDEPFLPGYTGFSFSNAGTNMWPDSLWKSIDYSGFPEPPDTIENFPDWYLYCEAYGDDWCFRNGNSDRPRSRAIKHWQSILTDWGGSCLGFSTASLLWLYGNEFNSDLIVPYEPLFYLDYNTFTRNAVTWL